MARKYGPIPQTEGQLVPPRRRPPTAVAIDTPEPPERSLFRRLVKWLAELVKQLFRAVLSRCLHLRRG